MGDNRGQITDNRELKTEDRSQKADDRKKHIFFCFLFSIFYFLFSIFYFLLIGCAKQEIKNIDSKGENIICLGDSITFGYGAEPGEDYPSILAELTGLAVINAGQDGDTSLEGLSRLKADVLDKQPLLVIIQFGGNDFLKKIPLKETVNNIKEMIDKIHSAGAFVALADISAGLFLKEYRSKLYKIAKEKHTIFIPNLLEGILASPPLKSDFIHPNAKGYKLIAQKVYRSIRPYLKPKF